MFLESFIHSIPDQAAPDHSGAGCCIVCHLGELVEVDVDSLCRGEPGIRGMTTALYLKHQGGRIRHRTLALDGQKLTANGVFVASITFSWLLEGVVRFRESGEGY